MGTAGVQQLYFVVLSTQESKIYGVVAKAQQSAQKAALRGLRYLITTSV